MNEIVNKFLLAGDKFMPEMTTRIYIQCLWTITRNKERIQKYKDTQDSLDIFNKTN